VQDLLGEAPDRLDRGRREQRLDDVGDDRADDLEDAGDDRVDEPGDVVQQRADVALDDRDVPRDAVGDRELLPRAVDVALEPRER
jgi:hypothetical protein